MTAAFATDSRLRSGRTGTRWRPAWAWGKDTEAFVRERLREAPRPVVHAGCGSSRVGDVRLDRYHPGVDLRADAAELPFKDRSAGTVLQDPPWTVAHLVDRQRWVSEAVRVLRPGGLYVVHAPWMPARPTLKLLEVHVRDDSTFNGFPRSPVLLSVWCKIKDGARRGAVPAARPSGTSETKEDASCPAERARQRRNREP